MSLLMPKKEENSFETVPEGVYTAVCYRVIDLGTQEVDFKGDKKYQHKIMLSWELHAEDVRMQDGRPFSTHKRYTLSSNEKSALRKDLEAWRGQAFTDQDFGNFDIGVLIGKACMMQIVHNVDGDKVYANVNSIMKLPKGMETPKLENETIYFSIDAFLEETFSKLSENLQETIKKSPEYAEVISKRSAAA